MFHALRVAALSAVEPELFVEFVVVVVVFVALSVEVAVVVELLTAVFAELAESDGRPKKRNGIRNLQILAGV